MCRMAQISRGNVWQWVKLQIVQQVSDEDAFCEYDCRKSDCTDEEWASCQLRIRRLRGFSREAGSARSGVSGRGSCSLACREVP
jgi:hypothetical protein